MSAIRRLLHLHNSNRSLLFCLFMCMPVTFACGSLSASNAADIRVVHTCTYGDKSPSPYTAAVLTSLEPCGASAAVDWVEDAAWQGGSPNVWLSLTSESTTVLEAMPAASFTQPGANMVRLPSGATAAYSVDAAVWSGAEAWALASGTTLQVAAAVAAHQGMTIAFGSGVAQVSEYNVYEAWIDREGDVDMSTDALCAGGTYQLFKCCLLGAATGQGAPFRAYFLAQNATAMTCTVPGGLLTSFLVSVELDVNASARVATTGMNGSVLSTDILSLQKVRFERASNRAAVNATTIATSLSGNISFALKATDISTAVGRVASTFASYADGRLCHSTRPTVSDVLLPASGFGTTRNLIGYQPSQYTLDKACDKPGYMYTALGAGTDAMDQLAAYKASSSISALTGGCDRAPSTVAAAAASTLNQMSLSCSGGRVQAALLAGWPTGVPWRRKRAVLLILNAYVTLAAHGFKAGLVCVDVFNIGTAPLSAVNMSLTGSIPGYTLAGPMRTSSVAITASGSLRACREIAIDAAGSFELFDTRTAVAAFTDRTVGAVATVTFSPTIANATENTSRVTTRAAGASTSGAAPEPASFWANGACALIFHATVSAATPTAGIFVSDAAADLCIAAIAAATSSAFCSAAFGSKWLATSPSVLLTVSAGSTHSISSNVWGCVGTFGDAIPLNLTDTNVFNATLANAITTALCSTSAQVIAANIAFGDIHDSQRVPAADAAVAVAAQMLVHELVGKVADRRACLLHTGGNATVTCSNSTALPIIASRVSARFTLITIILLSAIALLGPPGVALYLWVRRPSWFLRAACRIWGVQMRTRHERALRAAQAEARIAVAFDERAWWERYRIDERREAFAIVSQLQVGSSPRQTFSFLVPNSDTATEEQDYRRTASEASSGSFDSDGSSATGGFISRLAGWWSKRIQRAPQYRTGREMVPPTTVVLHRPVHSDASCSRELHSDDSAFDPSAYASEVSVGATSSVEYGDVTERPPSPSPVVGFAGFEQGVVRARNSQVQAADAKRMRTSPHVVEADGARPDPARSSQKNIEERNLSEENDDDSRCGEAVAHDEPVAAPGADLCSWRAQLVRRSIWGGATTHLARTVRVLTGSHEVRAPLRPHAGTQASLRHTLGTQGSSFAGSSVTRRPLSHSGQLSSAASELAAVAEMQRWREERAAAAALAAATAASAAPTTSFGCPGSRHSPFPEGRDEAQVLGIWRSQSSILPPTPDSSEHIASPSPGPLGLDITSSELHGRRVERQSSGAVGIQMPQDQGAHSHRHGSVVTHEGPVSRVSREARWPSSVRSSSGASRIG